MNVILSTGGEGEHYPARCVHINTYCHFIHATFIVLGLPYCLRYNCMDILNTSAGENMPGVFTQIYNCSSRYPTRKNLAIPHTAGIGHPAFSQKIIGHPASRDKNNGPSRIPPNPLEGLL